MSKELTTLSLTELMDLYNKTMNREDLSTGTVQISLMTIEKELEARGFTARSLSEEEQARWVALRAVQEVTFSDREKLHQMFSLIAQASGITVELTPGIWLEDTPEMRNLKIVLRSLIAELQTHGLGPLHL